MLKDQLLDQLPNLCFLVAGSRPLSGLRVLSVDGGKEPEADCAAATAEEEKHDTLRSG